MKLRQTFLEQITKLMNQGMFDLNIVDKNDKELTTTVLMDKKELEEYIDRLNDYYEVTYYEMFNLDEPKKSYQKKYFTIDEINKNGERFFKLIEVISDNKKYPIKKENRIIGAIRIKEKEQKVKPIFTRN